MDRKRDHCILTEAKLTEMVKSALRADKIEMVECRDQIQLEKLWIEFWLENHLSFALRFLERRKISKWMVQRSRRTKMEYQLLFFSSQDSGKVFFN